MNVFKKDIILKHYFKACVEGFSLSMFVSCCVILMCLLHSSFFERVQIRSFFFLLYSFNKDLWISCLRNDRLATATDHPIERKSENWIYTHGYLCYLIWLHSTIKQKIYTHTPLTHTHTWMNKTKSDSSIAMSYKKDNGTNIEDQ